MSPRRPDPAIPVRLLEVAARLLSEEGPSAVSARKVATEAGASTMAVYTHFGSMDELLAAVRREGFRRFAEELDRPSITDDPVADWMAQGWGYRHFALTERHLYRVMFDSPQPDPNTVSDDDNAAAMAALLSLHDRIERCAAAGRWRVDDVPLAGEVIWSTTHGHCSLEHTGYFGSTGRDPADSYSECMLRLAVGFGDAPEAAAVSWRAGRRRASRGSRR